MKRLVSVLLVAVSSAACTGTGDAEYAELGLGTADPVLHLECVPLPLTPGSAVIEDLELGGGVAAHVVAVPDSIDVTLGRTTTFEHRVLSHDQVYDGYAERILVQTQDGQSHTVVLVSPCDSD